MSHSKEQKLEAFGEMLDVLDTLREKCPWDAKQTNESLRPNSVEEMFELADALIRDDIQVIKKEYLIRGAVNYLIRLYFTPIYLLNKG